MIYDLSIIFDNGINLLSSIDFVPELEGNIFAVNSGNDFIARK